MTRLPPPDFLNSKPKKPVPHNEKDELDIVPKVCWDAWSTINHEYLGMFAFDNNGRWIAKRRSAQRHAQRLWPHLLLWQIHVESINVTINPVE
jgi:hypothetical protein